MFNQGWQIGLHINTVHVSIVAITYQTNKWSLQGFWVFPLTEPVFTSTGSLMNTEELHTILLKIRTHFPYRYSLRVSYPAQCVLHRTLSLPTAMLNGLLLERFVRLSIERLFTHLHELTWDYRAGPDKSNEITVTVTRHKILNEYCTLFKRVGLVLDVVELASTSLYPLVHPLRNCGLIVEETESWLWAVYHNHHYYHGQLLKDELYEPAAVIKKIKHECDQFYCVTQNSNIDWGDSKPFSISLPSMSDSLCALSSRSESVVALGLALRQDDQL
ncbi:hypothetical protein [Rosenbergiella australiborealis]|uniref:hypothetical protein n=1 Tax=Rosenbergiella australiborealis TaxID=1544696 RepID=UPI001F4DF66E|nr:hypothetical protein [Rosenbergiella australiborealis]